MTLACPQAYRIRLMSYPRRHALLLKLLTLAAVLLALVALAVAWRQCQALGSLGLLKREGGFQQNNSLPAWQIPPLDPDFARLFRAPDNSEAMASKGKIAERYRLVGVLLHADTSAKSTAFIEEKATGRQRRLRVGDELEASVKVKTIASAEVWVVGPNGEERLVREGHGAASASVAAASSRGGAVEGDGEGRLVRFGGTRTGTNTWSFSRGAIMDYYQELLDRPERLVKVFDSLAPIYDSARQIEGYRVTIAGEADFFAAVGLHEGDIVRAVNSIEMTNRRRAENLIRRFAQDDLDLVIIELERAGRRIKQFYDTSK